MLTGRTPYHGPCQWTFIRKLNQDWSSLLYSIIYNVDNQEIIIRVATQDDKKYSTIITDEMESSAAARGTGIAKRSPEYIETKIDEGKAVIAVTKDGTWVGFCYIETWSHGE